MSRHPAVGDAPPHLTSHAGNATAATDGSAPRGAGGCPIRGPGTAARSASARDQPDGQRERHDEQVGDEALAAASRVVRARSRLGPRSGKVAQGRVEIGSRACAQRGAHTLIEFVELEPTLRRMEVQAIDRGVPLGAGDPKGRPRGTLALIAGERARALSVESGRALRGWLAPLFVHRELLAVEVAS